MSSSRLLIEWWYLLCYSLLPRDMWLGVSFWVTSFASVNTGRRMTTIDVLGNCIIMLIRYIIIDWLMHFLWRGRTWNFKATWENKGSLLLSLSHFPCSWVPIKATQLSPFPCNYSSELVPMATLSRPISGSTRRIHRTRHCIPYYMAIRRRI